MKANLTKGYPIQLPYLGVNAVTNAHVLGWSAHLEVLEVRGPGPKETSEIFGGASAVSGHNTMNAWVTIHRKVVSQLTF